MKARLKKVIAEIAKMEQRLEETEKVLKNLRAEKKMLEDLEIVKAIRSMNTEGQDVLELIDKMRKGRGESPAFLLQKEQEEQERD